MSIAESSTAPRPGPSFTNKTGFHGILLYVTHRLDVLRFISHVGIPIVALPKRTAPSQQPIRLARDKRLPGLVTRDIGTSTD